MNWQPIETAPKGTYSTYVTDPEYVAAPKILLLFQGGQQVVCYWDWYYAEGGSGHSEGVSAWTEPTSGEQIAMHHGEPIRWMPLPEPTDKGIFDTRPYLWA